MVKQHLIVMGGTLSAVVAVLASFKVVRRADPHAPARASSVVERAIQDRAKSARPADGKVSEGPPRMLHLDPRHTNRSPFAGPSSPKVLWTFDTLGPIAARLRFSRTAPSSSHR